MDIERRQNAGEDPPPTQSPEPRLKPSQVALAGVTLLAVFAGAWLILKLKDVLIMAFIALVIAATIRPMKVFLRRLRLPKFLAIAMVYLGILGVFVAFAILVIPTLVVQGEGLVTGLPQLYAGMVSSLQASPDAFLSSLPGKLPSGDQLAAQLQAMGGSILRGAMDLGKGIASFVAQMLAIVALSVYLTAGQSRLERFWLSLAPAGRRSELLGIWRQIESRLGSYVRGELLLMAFIGVLAGLGYLVMGLPYALALGAIAGLLEFVPMVGPILGALPAIVVALSISPHLALIVVGYSIVIQLTENNILVPRLMGHSVGVSPVTVILSVFSFTALLGIIGAFLAIPLAAIIQVLMDHLIVHAGLGPTDEAEEENLGVLPKLRSRIRRLRVEGLRRLRSGSSRINLAAGDSDDMDAQAERLLDEADETLTDIAQNTASGTVEEYSSRLADVELAVDHAGAIVKEAKVDEVIVREDQKEEGRKA
jgi:predicted PurR-regulated permease PerM